MFFGKKKRKGQTERSESMIAGDVALQGTVRTPCLGCIRSDSSDMFNMSAVFPSCSNPSQAPLSLPLPLPVSDHSFSLSPSLRGFLNKMYK